ncbi:transcription factor Dp-2, partial [Aphelenchoides avenae]
EKQQYDMKNIRRRVYDALNVLMAMNIIEKEKKEIRWVGLPTSSYAEVRRLQEEKTQRQDRIRQKTEQLQELILQLVAYKSLVQRNRDRERDHGRPSENSILYLPYIIVNTDKKTMIDCQISHDKSEYWFNFDQPFEIHDDIEVLKRLGLSYGLDRCEVAAENIPHIKNCLPPALQGYVDQIIEGTLAGGAINKSVQGPQTVVISANMQERKPKIVTHSVAGRPAVAGYGVQSSPGGFSRRLPIQQQTRYAVVPRPAHQGMRYTPGTQQHIVYRAGPQGGRPFVLQSNTAHQSRIAPHPHQNHAPQQQQHMTVGTYLQQQHAQRAVQHSQPPQHQHSYQQPQHHEPHPPPHAQQQHHEAYQHGAAQQQDDEGQDFEGYEEIISDEHHY